LDIRGGNRLGRINLQEKEKVQGDKDEGEKWQSTVMGQIVGKNMRLPGIGWIGLTNGGAL
jgi:hypothetical protein